MDPKQRLGLNDLSSHTWLTGDDSLPHTPLMTPGVLGRGLKRTYVGNALNATVDAFQKATRDGFTLMEVANAPLAKRRKLKKSVESTRSLSTTSTASDSTPSNGSLSPYHEQTVVKPSSSQELPV